MPVDRGRHDQREPGACVVDEVLADWGLEGVRQRDDIELAGSPQRCLERFALEDRAGQIYVLERIPRSRLSLKTRIAETLAFLRTRGLTAANPYLRSVRGGYLVAHEACFWQLAHYVAGVAPERPGYAQDAWRGQALAGFMLDLRACASHVPVHEGLEPFDLARFVRHLTVRLCANAPEVLERVRPALSHLEAELLPSLPSAPLAFCHGDLHALNVIWSERGIAAVIDWEFSGLKPESYDLANLIGCVGSESAGALDGDLVGQLLARLRSGSYLSPASWRLLPEIVIVTRLAWLSEWMRNREGDMVAFEQDYIALLLDRAAELRVWWRRELVPPNS